MQIFASASEPPVLGASWDERHNGFDKGLISAWLAGRDKRQWWPDVVAALARDELPILPFKGGIEEKKDDDKKQQKPGKKVGSLHYLAMRQGLLGENLDIDTEKSVVKICSKTLVRVVFTGDMARLLKVSS